MFNLFSIKYDPALSKERSYTIDIHHLYEHEKRARERTGNKQGLLKS